MEDEAYKNGIMNRRISKHSIKVFMIGILGAAVVFVVLLRSLAWLETTREQSRVEEIANHIERFKNQYGRLPDTENREEMLSLGFELHVGWQPDFVVLNDSDYELWLYYGFDGPHLVYSSRTKTWREEY